MGGWTRWAAGRKTATSSLSTSVGYLLTYYTQSRPTLLTLSLTVTAACESRRWAVKVGLPQAGDTRGLGAVAWVELRLEEVKTSLRCGTRRFVFRYNGNGAVVPNRRPIETQHGPDRRGRGNVKDEEMIGFGKGRRERFTVRRLCSYSFAFSIMIRYEQHMT